MIFYPKDINTWAQNINKMKKIILIVSLMFLVLVTNAQKYLFIGTDSRSKELSGNADMILVMSINKNTMALASIMRDTYVKIPNHGMDKINAAFRLGSSNLLLSTINSNFGLDLKSYIIVDFINAAKAVNMLGGLDVFISEEERLQINKHVKEQIKFNEQPFIEVKKIGNVSLNGDQVLAYSRIRSTLGGDRTRTERQRRIFGLIIKKMSSNKTNFDNLRAMYTLFNTNINFETALQTATILLKEGYSYPKTKTFPDEIDSEGMIKNKIWYLKTNLPATSVKLKTFLK